MVVPHDADGSVAHPCRCARVSLAHALDLTREVEAANLGSAPLEQRLALYDRLVAALNEAKSSVRHSISGGAQPCGTSLPGPCTPIIDLHGHRHNLARLLLTVEAFTGSRWWF